MKEITDREVALLIAASDNEHPLLLSFGGRGVRLTDSPLNAWARERLLAMRAGHGQLGEEGPEA